MPNKREEEESTNLEESMTESTAKLVEKLVREEKTASQTDLSHAFSRAFSSDIANILQIVKREEEKNRVSRELQAKIWERMSRETEPRQGSMTLSV